MTPGGENMLLREEAVHCKQIPITETETQDKTLTNNK
jgi:hypothetical protein